VTPPPSFAPSPESCVTARSFSAALPAQYRDVSGKSYSRADLGSPDRSDIGSYRWKAESASQVRLR
jgi:hypothetical protein